MTKKEFEKEMGLLYGFRPEISSDVLNHKFTKEELTESYERVYMYLYNHDTNLKIQRGLMPVYEYIVENNVKKARYFQKDILGGEDVGTDRQYAAAAIVMYLYDELVKQIIKDNELIALTHMALYYALGK